MNKHSAEILTDINLLKTTITINDVEHILAHSSFGHELAFDYLLTHKKFPSLCHNHSDAEKILDIFPGKENIIFEQLANEHKISTLIENGRELNSLLDLFPEKKYSLANIYFNSNKLLFHGPDPEYGFSNCISYMISHLPEEKERIFANVVASQQKQDLELIPFDIEVLAEKFPDAREIILNEFVINSKKSNVYYDKAPYLNTLLELFPKNIQIISNRFSLALIHPDLFAPKQYGPTCGFNALSTITKYFSILENNPNLFFSVKKEASNINNGLMKIGKETVGIQGPGAIFSLNLFINLIKAINLFGEVLYIPEQKKLTETICRLIDLKIPVILPYDKENNGGDNAHYAIICGYKSCKEGAITFLITHHNRYEFLDAETLFQLNDNLYACSTETYVKNTKDSHYQRMSSFSHEESYYKNYTYPTINLENTLKNRLLIVLTPQMKMTLEENGALNQFNKFIESNPKDIEYVLDHEQNRSDDNLQVRLKSTEYSFSETETDEDNGIDLMSLYTDSFLFNTTASASPGQQALTRDDRSLLERNIIKNTSS